MAVRSPYAILCPIEMARAVRPIIEPFVVVPAYINGENRHKRRQAGPVWRRSALGAGAMVGNKASRVETTNSSVFHRANAHQLADHTIVARPILLMHLVRALHYTILCEDKTTNA